MANEYTPVVSLRGFYGSDATAFVAGPVGSGKSTALFRKIPRAAELMRPSRTDGTRSSVVAVVRNTAQQLNDVAIPDMLRALPKNVFGTRKIAPWLYCLEYSTARGKVSCTIDFRTCGSAKDLDELSKANLSFACMEEWREIDLEVLRILQDRINRFPVGGLGAGQTGGAVWGASCMPDDDSPWWSHMKDEKIPFFAQPDAVGPRADWLHLLPDGYYDRIAQGQPPGWIDRFVHARMPDVPGVWT